ncbi:trypsin-like peptidase domain-containing protein [Paenibacillus sp. JX-17]|uniref:Trypsin-like peptidase domain-containing protein n=1 Tax=Paenibacillus lacisoli TaxID=3064525 RepID=A0ABT9CD96_9BACL|nr:trypsin-like peptidase domain-containing protein [Paenibacillus sp. JX-17]MDO7906624.1 trypsin-like peptidase domain-containing protein [Paenibacillus sp. JX-17]
MNRMGKKAFAVVLACTLCAAGTTTAAAAASTQKNTGKQTTAASVKAQNSSKTTGTYTAADPVPQVVKQVSPSVVGIIGRPVSGSASSSRYNLVHGTGVIYASNGWIITNAHVVEGLENALVVTSDGKSYKIQGGYTDPVSDIALIKINASGLKPAKLAASSQTTQVGERVIAIGTPVSFSLRNTATAGIVSGLNRAGVSAAYRLIQTDTTINPGNSGGPLVNLKGEVIGINSMKFVESDVENLGFSIPMETVRYVVKELLNYGEVRRAALGLNLEESWSAIVGLPTQDPMTVTKVLNKKAAAAGIQVGDELYSINGKRVTSVVDINELLKSYLPGQYVTVLMQSDGDIVKRRLQLDNASAVSTSSSGSDSEEEGAPEQ